MRRFRSVSDYLSLGAGPTDSKAAPLLGARVAQGPRLYERRDLVIAERITVKHLRDAAAELAEAGVPPNTADSHVLESLDDEDCENPGLRRVSTALPGAAKFGPYYTAQVPPQDMTALLGDPEFQAGERDGEFRVAGKGIVMVRPPPVAVDDIVDPATGKVIRCEVNAIRLHKET